MTLDPIGGYDIHRVVHAERSRPDERRIHHLRALQDGRSALGERARDGFLSRIVARLGRPALAGAQPAGPDEPHELADFVRRLSMSRAAAQGRWQAIAEAGQDERDGSHQLTDYRCRLADGTMGRVAIRHVDGAWLAVCMVV